MNITQWKVMIDVGFWTTLAKKKLEQYKLTSETKPLFAKYKLENSVDKIALLSIDAFSFSETYEEERMGPIEIKLRGTFLNTNTVEEFKTINLDVEENKLVFRQKQNIDLIIEGKTGVILPVFSLFTFADLKKHVFSYYFLSSAIAVKDYKNTKIESAAVAFGDQLPNLNIAFKQVILAQSLSNFFVLRIREKQFSVSSIPEFIEQPNHEYIFGYIDTVNYPGATGLHTSSVLAIFANLIQSKKVDPNRLKQIRLLLVKDFLVYNANKNYVFKNSQVWTFDLSEVKVDEESRLCHPRKLVELDLKAFMDQRTLVREAVDLNIKLMKWRLLPRLDIPKIMGKRCLLFGAGTLGCQLARNLIGWGIKDITFIDYSNVSYSNPVRQSLYEYQDTLKGGRPKALVAAQKLKKIYPQIKSEGYHISVPMPGHFVTNEAQYQQTFKNLDLIQKLVSEHDVLFLLLDSREARWLPTVLANKFDKACITVGLGFDSFVIVRHGVSPHLYDQQIHKERLSCYFCNDIVTPQDTMRDRTLDQMCTVTRPGLSFTSAAYASELYISLIHHPMEHKVWADEDSSKLETTDLGKLPHHLRGCMSEFEVSAFYGRAFEQCVACSAAVLNEYNSNRNEFMVKVLNSPEYIHQATGLDKQLKRMEQDYESMFIEINDDEEQEINK